MVVINYINSDYSRLVTSSVSLKRMMETEIENTDIQTEESFLNLNCSKNTDLFYFGFDL